MEPLAVNHHPNFTSWPSLASLNAAKADVAHMCPNQSTGCYFIYYMPRS